MSALKHSPRDNAVTITDKHKAYSKGPSGRALKAMDKGYYLEAILLWEGLIANRLETLLNFMQESNVQFSNFDRLLERLETVVRLQRPAEIEAHLGDLIAQLHDWRRSKNATMHGIARVPEGDTDHWKMRYKEARKVARAGHKLFDYADALASPLSTEVDPVSVHDLLIRPS
jgi:hypothetical protein